ncbi:class I SAM-dependent methyltransferase [Jatrophihabitans sp.]|jgi:SAM-dependent methyltransferase|uniref:class I SAM-dependent methyltransferase n=1 Tax=Jatrophihabitans sp. TaxID=1932789 RepID=UPI002EF0E2E1
MDEESEPVTRWARLAGRASGADYAARFARLAATGQDVHGEATFCAAQLPAPALVLDAGCGTGRVAIRLAELGYRTVGVDVDSSMLAEARGARPDLPWLTADLAALPGFSELARLAGLDAPTTGSPAPGAGFDLVVAAGNVIPLLAAGTLTATVQRLAAVLAPGGLLVAGFGLDAAHLPAGCPVTPAADYQAACAEAGLAAVARHGSWDGAEESSGYLVSVHRAPQQ